MSRDAATQGYERFLTSAIEATREEFSVRRALGGSALAPGGRAIDLLRSSSDELERLLVEPELAAHRERALSQFEVVVEYASSGGPIEAFADEILALDSYVEVLRADFPERSREAIEGEIVVRNRMIGEAIVPLLERPEDEFWPAMEGAFDRSDALAFVDRVFSFATPLRRRPDAFSFEARLDLGEEVGGAFASALPSLTVEFTDEAIRAMGRAEERTVHEATTEIRERFD